MTRVLSVAIRASLALSLAGVALGACSESSDVELSDEDIATLYEQPFNVEGCRAGDSAHWVASTGDLPVTGTWRVRWACVSDCRGSNAPALTTSDSVEIRADGTMRFRRGSQLVEQLPYSTVANCRIIQPSTSPCRSAVRVCGSTRCVGSAFCAGVTYAAWGQQDVNRSTAYEATLTR